MADDAPRGSAAGEYSTLQVAREGAVLQVVLNRPDRRNALTHEMMQELGRVFAAAAHEPGVRALVLRGAGDCFSAGGDIGSMAELPPPPLAGQPDPLFAAYRQFGTVLMQLDRLPFAVIALVQGVAVGGGFGMACCADLVLATQDARFGLPEPKAGFIPSQIIPFIVRRIGEAQARRLAVLAELIDAAEAHRLGIVHHVCADQADMQARLADALEALRRASPQAVAEVKQLVLAAAREESSPLLDRAAHSLVRLLRGPEGRAGMQAFLGKRIPPWAEQPIDAPRAGEGGRE